MGPRVVSTRRLYQMSDAIDTILGLGTSGKAEWGIFLLVHYRTFFSKFNCPFRNSLRHFFSAASSVASQWFDLFQRVFSIELGSPLMNPLVNGPVILASPARRVPGAAAQASAAATCLFVFFLSLILSLSLNAITRLAFAWVTREMKATEARYIRYYFSPVESIFNLFHLVLFGWSTHPSPPPNAVSPLGRRVVTWICKRGPRSDYQP